MSQIVCSESKKILRDLIKSFDSEMYMTTSVMYLTSPKNTLGYALVLCRYTIGHGNIKKLTNDRMIFINGTRYKVHIVNQNNWALVSYHNLCTEILPNTAVGANDNNVTTIIPQCKLRYILSSANCANVAAIDACETFYNSVISFVGLTNDEKVFKACVKNDYYERIGPDTDIVLDVPTKNIRGLDLGILWSYTDISGQVM